MAGFDPADGILFVRLPSRTRGQAGLRITVGVQPCEDIPARCQTTAPSETGECVPCNRDPGWSRSARGARAHLMTGDHRNRIAQPDSKDVPLFAPNFTVYVLPPDVVCLYSEDRKFFLRGELYCALASAIGEGERSFRELVLELEPDFPSDAIHEALKRLVDRRFVVSKRVALVDTASAYWASLGLPPETAESNLQKCRCAHSIDRRKGCTGARRRPKRAGRSRIQAFRRSDGHAGERLSRRAAG